MSHSTASAASRPPTTTSADGRCLLTLTPVLRRRRRILIRTLTRWQGGGGRIMRRRVGRRRMWVRDGRGRGGGRGLVRRRVRGRSGMGRGGRRGWCLRLGLWCVRSVFICMLLTGVLARRSWQGCSRLCRRHWRMRFSRLTLPRLLQMPPLILPTHILHLHTAYPLLLLTTLRLHHHLHPQEDSASHSQWTSTNDTGKQ